MPETQKVTVLLADADSLRRDGLAAVLKSHSEIEVIGGCPDGNTALDEIRSQRPEIAVVDLNLPGLHGIELVRRVRGEQLGTKIIIVSGTTDDEIVREVVRAGADAYLLKNGPARHMVDAINYVRDGGQYFSPQLGRDGRDRHLLEEPARVPPQSDAREKRPRARTMDPARFRERIREETSRDLGDRDYEIMSEMADGIRPILDRLDEIEGRVLEMEEGEEPLPADPRGWLSTELADSLSGSRSSGRGVSRMSTRDLEANLPQMIEEAVTKRFQSMAGKLQEEIEEQHVRTLETFVKNIQTKLVQRVSLLEQNMTQQAEAMHQLREYNQRTEDNLSRLISGVDRLAQELPKRLAAPQAEAVIEPQVQTLNGQPVNARDTREPAPLREKRSSRSGSSSDNKILPWVLRVVLLVAVIGGGGYWVHSKFSNSDDATPAKQGQTSPTGKSETVATAKPVPPASGADTKTKLEAARQYVERKEYATAEDIYKQIVQAEPNNVDALKALASVLYREDKIEESTQILDRLPKN
jgi:DNA-binding NarL/FixJ family response regulator/tetratricopeptide (TPR) repeat protein